MLHASRRVAITLLAIFFLSELSAIGQDLSGPQIASGIYRGRWVTYKVVNGKEILEGDILLDRVDQQAGLGTPQADLGVAYPTSLWLKVGSVYQVPYTITSGGANVTSSITAFNSTFSGIIQWVPHTSETDWVDFNLDVNDHSQVCNSFVGRVGGQQEIGGSIDCSNMLHEMGHAIGLWHVQSRADRDSYITINYPNIIKVEQINFDQVIDNAQPLGLYDYASIMQYFAYAFTKNGQPTIESIPPGIPLSSPLLAYSAGDVDGIMRLYGAPPALVTVTSNPVGLQVTVDGITITTPQAFNWALNSTHTLSASTNVQTLSGTPYVYGRWNDNGAAAHTITVLPGNGLTSQPASLPAVTAYTANFVRLVPYTATVFPANTGAVTATPPAQPFPGGTGVYYVARQPATLTATPNPGQNFYGFFNSPFWLPYSLSANPKNFNAPDDGTGISMTAFFTSSPVYTVTTNQTDPGLGVLIDGGFWYAPKNLSPAYDSGWTTGSSHSIGVFDPQLPWSTTFRYPWVSWSDSGAVTHNITVPASSTTYTATLGPQYQLIDFPNQGCAGSIAVSPTSGDGFYDSGAILSLDQTANSGWIFTGWMHDLTGTGNPQNLTANDELFVTADYNTNATALSISGLSPSEAVAGGGNFTLTIKGAGFTSSSLVFINNLFRTSKFVNSTTLTVAMTSADLATPGAFQVFVENFPNGAGCAAFGARPFFVANHPIVTPTPLSLAFSPQLIGTTSASKSVTLQNNGTSTVTISSITASGNFAQTNTCSTLAPGATCKITATFTPTVAGAISGAISVFDNAADTPQVISATGTGNTPLAISPASLSFGNVTVGSTSPAKTVTLTNNQSTTLTFTFAASGNYTAVGSGTSPCGASLAALAKCTMSVTFKPTANGAINGAVTVVHNAAFTPQEVTLSGNGVSGPTSPLTLNPTSLTFAAQLVGSTSAAKSVTVTNVSASSLSISSLAASGNFTAIGSGTTPCTGALAAGASCTFSVTFAPSINGTIKGAAVITDTAAVGQQVLNLTGTAVLPVSFAPTTLTFAAQAVGTTSTSQTVTMTNNQSTTLTITGIGGSGDFTAVAGGTTPCGSTLASKKKCTFVVTFTPSTVGTVKGAATVTHNAPNNPQAVTLTGTGQ